MATFFYIFLKKMNFYINKITNNSGQMARDVFLANFYGRGKSSTSISASRKKHALL